MTDTIREDILQDVATTLAGLTVANGYHYNLGSTVERARHTWQDHELPAVSIWDTTETVSARGFGTLDIDLELQVDAVLAHDPDTINPSVAINRALGDVIKIMTTGDSTRGDLARATQYTSSSIAYPEPGASGIVASVLFNLNYTVVKGDPFTSA